MTLVLLNDNRPAHLITRVPAGEANREHPLRDLIYDNPAMLPVHELDPGISRVVSVAKELNLPGAGFLDLLLVTAEGRLIIVECKLWRNPQARREVIAQIVNYAGELARYSYQDLQRAVSNRLGRPGNILYELAVEAGTTLDEAAFCDRVSRDLRAGRFMLLIAGDGITENMRRIGDYLDAQAGLAFELGLIEMAEYRFDDPATGISQRIIQPRLLARTAVIERYVIRNEVPGVVIEAVEAGQPPVRNASSASGEAVACWKNFLTRFATSVRFDDPGQLPPRWGGTNWMKLPLEQGRYINLWRNGSDALTGASLRLTGADGLAAYEALKGDRAAIDEEFASDGLVLDWQEKEAEAIIRVTSSAPLPWDEAAEEAQRRWYARAANRFINSLRPRLERLLEPA